MAKEKDFMESQDFLGDLFKNVGKSTGASLFEKLATNARQEAIQPLVKSLQIQQFTKPLTELADKAEAAQKAGMAAYIAANPEIDESLLYDGTGDLVNGIMQENNLRFREINRQLSFMDIRNPKYQELANELNKINTTSAQLREDNKKLLGIRNLMKDENRVEELSKGMSSSQQAMYNDILTGNNQNFVNINGKLHWQDPDNADAEPVAISSVDAAGPTYSNSVVMEKHIGLYNEVINAQFVDDTVLHSKINNLWKMDGVGNTGLKSFIFDNQGASDAMGFDTSDWFDQWYKDQGIVGEEAQLAEKERIRNGGVLVDGAFVDLDGDGVPDKKGNVKQHFSAWYHSKMKSNIASQYNKKKATETSTTGGGILDKNENKFELFVPDNFKYKSKLPALTSNNTYEGQTGTGENFGQTNSPFAGITQEGWSEAGLDSNDFILEFGSGEKVVKALTDSYAKYGFKFEESGTLQDKLKVYHNNILKGEVEFDNITGDKANAKKLQQIMHLAVGLPSTQSLTTKVEE